MPAYWDIPTKHDRMQATRQHYVNGFLDLLSEGGLVLASFQFTDTAGSVAEDIWTLGLRSHNVLGTVAATPRGTHATKARLRTAGGVVGCTGITVGTSNAEIIMTNTNVATGQNVAIINTPVLQHG